MPEWAIELIVIGIVIISFWVTGYYLIIKGYVGRNRFFDELERNDKHPPPQEHQIKWHIQHMREDMLNIVHLLNAILIVLIIMLVKDFL